MFPMIGILLAALPAQPGPTNRRPVTVARVYEVYEQRVRQLKRASIDHQYANDSSMTVTLNLGGFVGRLNRWAGKWRIDEAVDDRGTDLRPDDRLTRAANSSLKKANYDGDRCSCISANLQLKASSRKATAISRLRGTLIVLDGGESKLLSFPKFKSRIGKKLDDPLLKAAGIDAELLPPNDGGGPEQFILKMTGRLYGLDEDRIITVTDASGRNMVKSAGGGGDPGEYSKYTYVLERPVGDDMALKIPLLVGQRERPVEFDIKDIPLP